MIYSHDLLILLAVSLATYLVSNIATRFFNKKTHVHLCKCVGPLQINRHGQRLVFFKTFVLSNVRPAFFYTKRFVYNSVAICLIVIKLLHHAV